jgi:hypothetical protein
MHYLHLLDIDPRPRVKWNFNPPETWAARHSVRAVKTEELKEVLWVPVSSFRNGVSEFTMYIQSIWAKDLKDFEKARPAWLLYP